MSHFELHAETRTDVGKGASRRLRRLQNKIPAILYGAGKEPTPLTVDHNKLVHSLENEAFYSSILTLKLDGKSEKVVLKALQRHPCKPFVFHMDLQRVSASEKLHMTVPLHFENEDTAVGVKQGGGIISHLLTQVDVSCLPADLPEFIAIDIASLELDQTLHLSDLTLPNGVELIALVGETPNDLPVVSIHLPRAEKAEEAEGAEGEGAEGEGTEEAPKEAGAESEGDDKKED